MTATLESVKFDLDGLQIAALRHRSTTGTATVRMLCLHGWLDNAASFMPLMPYLPSIDMVAIDMLGHGHSAHVPATLLAGYSLFDYVRIAHAVMEALEWPSCHLAGHSLGACIAPMLAVAAPDRIQSLLMIEAAGPLSEEADRFPERLVRALDDRTSPQRFRSRTFASKEDAVDARLAATRMERASARLIIDRQVVQAGRPDGTPGDGWRWRFDPVLRQSSPQYQTEAQARAVLGAVACRSLSIIADDGFLGDRDNTDARLACLPDNTAVHLPGYHHVHMDTPEPVAAAINSFLGTTPALH